MKFLANENIPLASVNILRNAGILISSITEDSPGIDDRTVLAKAKANSQIILTFDSDYGEMIFKNKLPTPAGKVQRRQTRQLAD